jgi:outer membrane lipoprotein-sorting protein
MAYCFFLLLAPFALAQAENSASQPSAMLIQNLAAMNNIQAVRLTFVCEKKLQVLDKPFVSGGVLVIAQPDRVRFQTDWPYQSCYILHAGKVFSRNQTDAQWHSADLDRQQAIQTILNQFAAWALGQTQDIDSDYRVTMVQSPLEPPPSVASAKQSAHATEPVSVDLFTLVPRDPAVAQAVAQIELGFSPQTHHLIFIAIISSDGDASRFWFDHIQINPDLPATCFEPAGPA